MSCNGPICGKAYSVSCAIGLVVTPLSAYGRLSSTLRLMLLALSGCDRYMLMRLKCGCSLPHEHLRNCSCKSFAVHACVIKVHAGLPL